MLDRFEERFGRRALFNRPRGVEEAVMAGVDGGSEVERRVGIRCIFEVSDISAAKILEDTFSGGVAAAKSLVSPGGALGSSSGGVAIVDP